MRQRIRFRIVIYLVAAVGVVPSGSGLVFAQPPPEPQAKGIQADEKFEQKSAYERRKEAKKRLEEALEARRVQRRAVNQLPQNQGGKGGTK